jgi:hypothetical protein
LTRNVTRHGGCLVRMSRRVELELMGVERGRQDA